MNLVASEMPEHELSQHARVVVHLAGDFESAAALLDDAREDILAFSAFP